MVLVPFVVSLGLAVVGALLVAKVAQLALRQLDLDLVGVLLWLGLAEAPVDELSVRRRAQPSFGKSAAGGRLLYRAK